MIPDRYRWAGGEEAMLRFGPTGGPVVAIAPPLLEEHNRTRAILSALARALAARGIGALLPDLPGQGDSPEATAELRLARLRAAFEGVVAVAGARPFVAAVRSGALVAIAGTAHWQLAPQTGDELLREWERLRAVGDGDTVAGNRLSPDLLTDLAGAVPPPARIVRLAGDPRPTDHVIDAPPPWRRAEPAGDPALAEALAADIAGWIATCAA